MTPPREPLRPAGATLAAFVAMGTVDLQSWLFARDATGAARAEAALFDWLHFVAVGAFGAGLVLVLELATRRLRASRPWAGRALAFGLGYAASLALGALVLREDFENFAARQESVPEAVASWGGVALVSLAVPCAAAFGTALRARFGRAPFTELAALAVLCAVTLLNGVVLPNDYRGIHLYLALCAVALAAASWTSSFLLARFARASRPAFGVATCAALVALFVRPSSAADLALERSTSAAVSPLVAAARARLPGADNDGEGAAATLPRSEWLEPRNEARPVPASQPPLLGKDPIVILVTVDALRADVVTGKHDEQLPVLASLRRRAVWFSEARAAGTLTKVSLAALFQSTYFSQQRWTVNDGPPHVRRDRSPRFPELLRKAGVDTINYRSISWLRNGNVVRGFDEDTYVGPKRGRAYTPSKEVFGKLLPRVKRIGKGPTFLWTHLSDPHAPYDLGGERGSEFERYLAEVALVDEQLGRLLATLREAGLEKRTLLVVSADHGESFGEHRSDTHGTTVYDETMRVPLFFVGPEGVMQPRRVDQLVSLVDLAPTMLDLFGLPTPGHMMGQSLVPFLRGQDPELGRYVVAEARQFRTLITHDKKKVIQDVRSGRSELYDLTSDPLELRNLASDREALRAPKATLDAFFEAHALTKGGYQRPIVR